MSSFLARVLSIVFHPVFMPVYGLLLYFNSGTYIAYLPLQIKKYIFLVVVVNTAVVPLSLLPLFLYSRLIRSIEMEVARERVLPLLVNILLYFFAYYLLVRMHVPVLLRAYMLASLLTLMLVMILSCFFHISLHMVGIGGLLGALAGLAHRLQADLSVTIMLILLLAGLVGTARLKLKAHHPVEVYSGFILGFVCMFTGLVLLWGHQLHS